MTFQEILEGITRKRAAALQRINAQIGSADEKEWAEIHCRINELEQSLQALAETLRDREAELKAFVPFGHCERNEVDAAFDEYEKRE